MVNYHYHGENRVITRYLPSMPPGTHPTCVILFPCWPCSARRNCFTWIIFFHDCIFYTKIRGNENSPDSLNVMVNYHYHGENRVITRYLPYMGFTRSPLPQNIGNLPLPFFGGNYPFVLLNNIY